MNSLEKNANKLNYEKVQKTLLKIDKNRKKYESQLNFTNGNLGEIFTIVGKIKNNEDNKMTILEERIKNYKSSEVELKIIKCLINSHYDIYTNYKYLMMESIIDKHLDIVELLIKNNAELQEMNDNFLLLCIMGNKYKFVEIFIKNGANVQFNNDEPLRSSAKRGFLEITKLLVNNGANICAENNGALYISCVKNHIKIVDYLLSCYSFSELKNAFNDQKLINVMLNYLMKKDLSKYDMVVTVFRELGIDVFDMIEKET